MNEKLLKMIKKLQNIKQSLNYQNCVSFSLYLIILFKINNIKLMKFTAKFIKLILSFCFLYIAHSKCAFQVGPDGKPLKTDRQPFLLEGLTICKQYNGLMGCCDEGNDEQQKHSYVELDGVFSSLGGGCDICAINLKRFWCQYACSPNQSQFADVQEGYSPVPNPQKPDQILMVQKLVLRVQASTACDIYNACSRNQFVSSVSAMSTPAGFLTFQGHNAVNDAFQYIQTKFSYNKSDSIYFGNQREQISGKALHLCNTTTSQKQIHGFDFLKNCSCNNCQSSCKSDQGFVYTQSGVLEDFNYLLVGGTWVVAIILATGVTAYRSKKEKEDDEKVKPF